jgi:uncharacterized NAD-dependent epimerase/dehydratase family protein
LLARASGARIWDLRRPPEGFRLPTGVRASIHAKVILTVGSDCDTGKMTTAFLLAGELKRRGIRANIAATGQTGIYLAGSGIAVDRVISDFVAGASERLVVDSAKDADFVIVEGQGALVHPAYSAVALGLLHGSSPMP